MTGFNFKNKGKSFISLAAVVSFLSFLFPGADKLPKSKINHLW